MEELSGKDSLGKGIVFQYAYYAVLTLSGAAFYLYVTHIFPTSTVGSIALLLAIVGLFPVFFTLGLQYGWQHFVSYAIGENNTEEIKRLIRQAIRTGLLLSGASVIFLVATAHYISIFFFHTGTYTSLILLMGLDIAPAIMIQIMNGIMLGLQNFRRAGIIGMTYVVLVYGSSVILLRVLNSLDAVPIGWGIGYLAGAFLYYAELSRVRMRHTPGKRDLREIVRYSLPLYATGILSFGATYIDRLTVAFLKNLSSIGVYTLVLLIVSGTGLLSAPIGGIVFSKFSEFYARRDREMIREGVRISVSAASVLYVPAALGLSALSVPVLRVLGGPAYVAGSVPLTIILVVSAFFIAGGTFGSALQGTRKTHIFVISASLSLLSNFILSVALIPTFSLIGAAIGFSSVTAVGFSIIFYFARKSGVVHVDVRMLAKIWLSAVTMAVLVYVFAFLTGFAGVLIPLYVISGAVVYILMLRFTSALGKKDKEMLLSLIPASLSPLRTFVELL